MIALARSANHRHAGGGFLPTFDEPAMRPSHDFVKLLLTALVCAFGGVGLFALYVWLFPR
jgi:hypothetical protein